jgi:CheY-like chemotaxis protein
MPSLGQLERTMGVANFLIKPIRREALLDAVRAIGPTVRTVLIVDDDAQIVRLLSRMLQSAPECYESLHAFSGEEGLDVLRRRIPDLILLDLLMPGVDGLAFLAQIKRDPRLAAIPVIAISAQTPGDLLTPATESTISLVSGRPLAVNELVRSVQLLLDALPPETGDPASARDSPAGLPE